MPPDTELSQHRIYVRSSRTLLEEVEHDPPIFRYQFRPQKAQPFGLMAFQWLTWESSKSGCTIRHQVNGREKRIGKRRMGNDLSATRSHTPSNTCRSYNQALGSLLCLKTLVSSLRNT